MSIDFGARTICGVRGITDGSLVFYLLWKIHVAISSYANEENPEVECFGYPSTVKRYLWEACLPHTVQKQTVLFARESIEVWVL